MKPTILCIDDESHILHVVGLNLRNAGYDVFTAEDGEEGLAAAMTYRPDLIIADYEMPFLDGLELCAELRQHELTHSIPVILLTARGFNLTARQLTRGNIVAVLSKPFSPRDVLHRVNKLIASRITDRADPAAATGSDPAADLAADPALEVIAHT